MPTPCDHSDDQLLQLMQDASSVLGLRLCFHDQLGRSHLPTEWKTHSTPPCVAIKLQHEKCVEFDVQDVHQSLKRKTHGRIHTCPFGFTEIAAPVDHHGVRFGVLFAGPCWTGKGKPPHRELVVPPSAQWLQERKTLVEILAHELGQLLTRTLHEPSADRRLQILRFVQASLSHSISLADLAKVLNLSPSRTGHVVRELFEMSLTQLANQTKMQEASRLLTTTDWPIAKVAWQVGFEDQNYFTRIFARQYGIAPKEYRKRHPAQA